MRDLFGEVPVTLDEVLLWMLAVSGLPPTSPRFAYYVRGWNVVEKIQRAKAEGRFEQILAEASARPSPWQVEFALAAARVRGFSAASSRA